MKRKTVVYLACPMRIGLWSENIRNCLECAERLRVKGYIPYPPVISLFWEIYYPRSVEDCLEYDFGLINVSDAVLRLPGASEGADMELDYAVEA